MRCPGGCNSHAISISNAHHVLVEESEVYDFHRHGISVFGSRWAVVRRCYANPRGLTSGGGTGIMLYGSSDSIVENAIAESSLGINIAGTPTYDGSPGGYRNRLLGVVTLGNVNGITIRARRFGSGHILPVGDNLVKDSVLAMTRSVGVFSRGAANTVLDHVTVWGTRYADGIAADQDAGEAPCSGNPASAWTRGWCARGASTRRTARRTAAATGPPASRSATAAAASATPGPSFPRGGAWARASACCGPPTAATTPRSAAACSTAT
jgi:hypothetical protein